MSIVPMCVQGFMQQCIRLLCFGYVYVSITRYPTKKQDEWDRIDEALVRKYPILDLTKYQRAYRKRRGLLNAQILRWGQTCVMLSTKGRDDIGILDCECFMHIKKRPIIIKASPGVTFKVGMRNKKFTASLDQCCREHLIAYYMEEAMRGRKSLVDEFKGLNVVAPSYSGVFKDKKRIRSALITSARQAGFPWKSSEFPIPRKRKSVKVFDKE